jgi:hypothetical protein
LQEATLHLDLSRSRARRVHAFGADSVPRRLDKDRSSQSLSAFYTFQKLTERHLKGRCQSRQVTETDLARTSFEVRYMNLMNTRLFGKVDLPPTPFLSELPDSFAKLDANIRRHSSSIDLVEALYLVDALSREIRVDDGSMVPVLRIAPACRGGPTTRRQWLRRQPKPKSYESSTREGNHGHGCGPLMGTFNDDSL